MKSSTEIINTKTFRRDLESIANNMGAKAFGVADLDKLKKQIPELLKNVEGEYSRAVVFGMRLQKAALNSITDKPTPVYFHNYRQLNYQLDSAALAVADKIQDAGFMALAIPASQYITSNPMSGHISHKLLGHFAGIGHIGRNNLLIHPKYGAQMRYVSVLTDMPLDPDDPYKGDCGSCRACVKVCPAGAIKDKKEDFDLNACWNKLNEFAHLPFIGQHVCGICVKACAGKGQLRC